MATKEEKAWEYVNVKRDPSQRDYAADYLRFLKGYADKPSRPWKLTDYQIREIQSDLQTILSDPKGGNPGMTPDKRLLKVAIEREPLKVASQLGYEVHRLSPTDIVDKADYASGYRFRLSKAVPNQPYPQIIMARSEGEVATFLKRQTEAGNPKVPEAVVRYKRNYGAGKSVFFVEYEYGGERYITGTVVRGTDRSLGWYFGKGKEGLREANRIVLLPDEQFSKAEDLAKYSWEKTRRTLSEGNPVPTGTCYEEAWRFLIKQEEGELIHGSVQTIGKRINHAWVELPTGYIWEPESGEFMKKSHFYERAEPIEEHRYNVEEAAIMLARVGKHGPWTDEERARWLPKKEGNPGMAPDKRLLKVAIEREPLKVAKQLGYEVHRLSPTDIVDKADYASGYRFRLSKAVPNQPYPQIVMARSEGEVATFLKRQTEGNPMPQVRRQGEWIYVRVGDTEMRGRPDPSGIEFEQVSPTYKRDELQKAVDTIEGMLKKGGSNPDAKEYWQMTLPEYKKTLIKPGDRVAWGNHYVYVKQALEEGKPVPPEVLADYPELTVKPSIGSNPMITDVDTCLKDIADFYIDTRRGITEPELESILLKHCGGEAEVQKFVSFLETEPGQLRFKTLLKERKGG